MGEPPTNSSHEALLLYETLAIVGLLIGGLFTLVAVVWVGSFLVARARARRSRPSTERPITAVEPNRAPEEPDPVTPSKEGPAAGSSPRQTLRGRLGRALLPVTAFILLQFGLFLWATAADVARAEASRSWPRARGVIAASRVESKERQGGAHHSVHISYGYAIAATPYAGRRVRFGGIPPDEAEQTVARYPEGKDVEVRYDPEDRHFALLEPGAPPKTLHFMWLCLVVVGLVAPVGLASLGARLVAWRRRRQGQTQGFP